MRAWSFSPDGLLRGVLSFRLATFDFAAGLMVMEASKSLQMHTEAENMPEDLFLMWLDKQRTSIFT